MRNKTYPIRLMLQALTLYNLGYSLGETAKRLKSKAGRAVSPPRSQPGSVRTKSRPPSAVFAPKRRRSIRRRKPSARSSSITARSTLSPITARSSRFCAAIRSISASKRSRLFLRMFRATCPHELFRREDDPKARASQAQPAFADINRLIINRKVNTATETAALIIPAVGNNKLRHETLQNFMLANDSSTVAIEIPIWLTEDEISALETRYGIELAAGGAPRSITGHIDFLQVRNDAIHILDYKPDARTNKPIAQLAIYALALTIRVPGLKLFDIKCAWFNEDEYNEFFPRTLFAKHSD